MTALPSGVAFAGNLAPGHEAAVAELRAAQRADTPAESIARARAALATFDAIAVDPSSSDWERRRARHDRLVAWNLLGRHDDILREVAALRADGVSLPPYVLGNEADALAALRRPEAAVAGYRAALAGGADDPAFVLGLAYALNDLDRPDQAIAVLAPLAARPGPEGRGARQLDAMLRAWSGWTDVAARSLADEAEDAPDDVGLRRQRADLERLRDRPLAALALLEGVDSAGASISRAQALDHHGDGPAASALLAALERESPDWWPLRRALAERSRDRRALVESRTRAARGDDVQIAAGEVRSETTVWSPLLDDRWRGFAAYRRAYADFRGSELEDERLAVGARLVGPGWRVQAEVNRAMDRNDDGTGAALGAEARLGDDWALAADAATRAFDLPLRARGAGITGDRYGLALRFSPVGQGFLRAALGRIDYSDGNRRADWSLSGSYRWPIDWWSGLTLSPAVAGSRNRRSDGPYFSPRRDLSADVALAWDHRFASGLDERHRQRVEVFAGRYRQEGFDSAPIGGVRYEYRYELPRRGSVYGRIGRDRRVYDGDAEFQTFFEIGIALALGDP